MTDDEPAPTHPTDGLEAKGAHKVKAKKKATACMNKETRNVKVRNHPSMMGVPPSLRGVNIGGLRGRSKSTERVLQA